ncbi:c-type cytochrome [Lysobacter sp. F6437]|uniref:c-type cytochrome n=1 Tax=Lysobacter sp. F6437 TaxID=3459296 RepID=UPI00403D8584
MADRRDNEWWEAIARLPRWLWSCLVGGSWTLALGRLLLAAVVFGLAGLLFVSVGLMPVAASQGHWPITQVLLHFVMRRSVQTHALAVKPPPPEERLLDTEAMVLKGAGHYAEGCLPCHGAPGHPRAEVVLHSVPEPPYLPPMVDDWNDRELFWIVKHGIKYTAMPAWPSQRRDDEAWAMVAFLRRLPQLGPAEFRQLAYGEEAEVPDIGPTRSSTEPQALANCARCHGRDGAGRGDGAFPPLAGQPEAYLLASLQAYARGDRHSGVMQPVAAALDASEMRALARYYAAADGGGRDGSGSGHGAGRDVAGDEGDEGAGRADAGQANALRAAIARGERLAREGVASRRVASCVECHGPGTSPRNALYPRLAGQPAAYIERQLSLFKQRDRGGTAYAGIMETVAARLEPDDIRDLALYYASLPADGGVVSEGPASRLE